MNLFDAQAAIVSTLTPLLDPIPVLAHGGTFTERELPMLLSQAPCVLIAARRLDGYSAAGLQRWSARVAWVAFCLAIDSEVGRAEVAMDCAYSLVRIVPQQRWGLDTQCKIPDFASIAADNLYSSHVNNLRVALWAVGWNQTHYFSEDGT